MEAGKDMIAEQEYEEHSISQSRQSHSAKKLMFIVIFFVFQKNSSKILLAISDIGGFSSCKKDKFNNFSTIMLLAFFDLEKIFF